MAQKIRNNSPLAAATPAGFQSVPAPTTPRRAADVLPQVLCETHLHSAARVDTMGQAPAVSLVHEPVAVTKAFVTCVHGSRRDIHIRSNSPSMRHIVVHDTPVGEGGQSVIYAAANPQTGIGLVYKQLRCKDMQAALAEAVQEASIAREMDSPVAPIVVQQENSVVLLAPAMPTDLLQSIRGIDETGDARWRSLALDVVKDIATDLLRLHSAGYVHCDLKADNVLSADGGWQLSDFGHAARRNDFDALAKTRGTSAFWSPEIYMGAPFSPQSDIYALGLLYLTVLNRGKPPVLTASIADHYADAFDWEDFVDVGHKDPGNSAWMQNHPEFARVYTSLSVDEQQLVRHMLHPDPVARPNARELLVDVAQVGRRQSQDGRRMLRKDSFRQKHHARMREVLGPKELERCSSQRSYGSTYSDSPPTTPRTPEPVDTTPTHRYRRE